MKKLFAVMLALAVMSVFSVAVFAGEATGEWDVAKLLAGENGMWVNAGQAESTDPTIKFQDKNTEAFSLEADFTSGSWVIELSIIVDDEVPATAEIGNFYTKAPDGDNTHNDYFVSERHLLAEKLEETGEMTYRVQMDVPNGATVNKIAFWSCGQGATWELKGVKIYKGTVEEGEEIVYPGDTTGDNSGDNTGDNNGDNTGDNNGDKNDDNTGNTPDDNKNDKPAKTGDVSAILAIVATGVAAFGGLKLKKSSV